jgi:hypothetical protein
MAERNSMRGTILLVGAAAILASAVVHGVINVPHLRADLIEMHTRPRVVGAVSLVLYFSVVAMGIFGALVLSAAVSAYRGKRPAAAPLWLVAAGYMTFGLAAFVWIDANVHFLGYAMMGLVVATGAALSAMGAGKSAREVA